MTNKHINSATNIFYIVEGSAEKAVIEMLVNKNELKSDFKCGEYGNYEIVNVEGRGNLRYSSFLSKTDSSIKDRMNSIFVILGDELFSSKVALNFFDHDEVRKLYDVNFNERFSFITINPEPEIIILSDLGIDVSRLNTTTKLKKAFNDNRDKIGYKFEEVKNYKWWMSNFGSKDLAKIIKHTQFADKCQVNDCDGFNVFSIKEILI